MSQIEITYTKESLSTGYFLDAYVHPYPGTDPTDLENCIVLNVSDGKAVRIATVAELTSITDAPVIRWITAPAFFSGGMLVSDVVRFITIPLEWAQLGCTAPYNVTIAALSTDYPVTGVRTSSVLPCEYSGDVTVGLYSSTGVEKIVPAVQTILVNRHDPAATGLPTYYRSNRVVSMFDVLADAESRYETLRAGAQALATQYRVATFVGDTTEIYE